MRPNQQTLRIMALGDSITAGIDGLHLSSLGGGYRGPLERLLAHSGYPVTFVGSRRGFGAGIGGGRHEGWGGYVIRSFPSDPGPGQLYGSLTQNAMQANDPDVVLLMAGTNDLFRYQERAAGYTLPNILDSMKLLIDQILAAKANVGLIVAPVVASPKLDLSTLRAFNGVGQSGDCANVAGGLSDLVDGYGKHFRVSFAWPMATSVSRDKAHFPDDVHPFGAGGYGAIARVWFDAIRAIERL